MNADGLWDVTLSLPNGDDERLTVSLRTDGGAVVGDATRGGETFELLDGKVAGDALTWRIVMGPRTFDWRATVDGDTISGSAAIGPMTLPFSGARA